jgi:endonuclease-8
MPEGDTIHRVATVLGREITGRVVERLALHDRGELADLAGRTVESVEPVGKHMFIHLSGGWSVRVHLGMNGRWRRQHVRQKRPRNPTVLMVVGNTAYLCEGAYRAEPVRTTEARRHPRVARLGPDLLAEPPEIDEAVRRARQPGNAGREVGDLLLDQRVAAGIGNVYKSEVLFECRIHPRTPVGELTPHEVRLLFETAARLMRLNLLTRRRTHVPLRRRPTPSSQRLWVYRRAGEPCLDCGTAIERILQGDMGRSTYFCPRCQGEASGS